MADTYLDENDALLGGNEIFQARMKGTGVIDRATALAFGMTGGCLRASGVDYDLRRDVPYCAYPELDFEVPLGDAGDNWDRYVVRVGEMRQCLRLIRQLLDGMPEGEYTAKVPKVLRPPAGEAYAAVESPARRARHPPGLRRRRPRRTACACAPRPTSTSRSSTRRSPAG